MSSCQPVAPPLYSLQLLHLIYAHANLSPALAVMSLFTNVIHSSIIRLLACRALLKHQDAVFNNNFLFPRLLVCHP